MATKRSILVLTAFCASALGATSALAGDYLVYDPGGSQSFVQASMSTLGFTYDTVTASTITAGAISSHKALIVGWTEGGDYSGLSSSLLSGITGNTIISGHDADFHTSNGVTAAAVLMNRYVQFAGGSVGNTGLVAFPDWTNPAFSWLPSSWGVSATGRLTSETIASITPDGTASGFYGGLTTDDLSDWRNSYHAYFNSYDTSKFKAFEMGSEGYAVTIGTTVTPVYIGTSPVPEPETYAMLLAGLGLLSVMARRRKA